MASVESLRKISWYSLKELQSFSSQTRNFISRYSCPYVQTCMPKTMHCDVAYNSKKNWNQSTTSITHNWLFKKRLYHAHATEYYIAFREEKTKLIYVYWLETVSDKPIYEKSAYRRKDNIHLFVWERIHNCILQLYIFMYMYIERKRIFVYVQNLTRRIYQKKKKVGWPKERDLRD